MGTKASGSSLCNAHGGFKARVYILADLFQDHDCQKNREMKLVHHHTVQVRGPEQPHTSAPQPGKLATGLLTGHLPLI